MSQPPTLMASIASCSLFDGQSWVQHLGSQPCGLRYDQGTSLQPEAIEVDDQPSCSLVSPKYEVAGSCGCSSQMRYQVMIS